VPEGEEQDSPMTPGDRFVESLAALGDDPSEEALNSLAQRYSYVFPDDRALATIARFGPLVEMGAGTGYWAFRLRALGVDIVAIDQAPPDGDRPNRYHAPTPTWTEVIGGDAALLTGHAERTLFLCWPPVFSTLGECLAYSAGNVVALIGDGGHRTARLRGLNADFTRTEAVPVRALEPMPGMAATLTIWQRTPRRSAGSNVSGSGADLPSTHH
jgi:hypothetical protein